MPPLCGPLGWGQLTPPRTTGPSASTPTAQPGETLGAGGLALDSGSLRIAECWPISYRTAQEESPSLPAPVPTRLFERTSLYSALEVRDARSPDPFLGFIPSCASNSSFLPKPHACLSCISLWGSGDVGTTARGRGPWPPAVTASLERPPWSSGHVSPTALGSALDDHLQPGLRVGGPEL